MKDYILTYSLPSGFQKSIRRMIPAHLEGELLTRVGEIFPSGCKLLAAEEIKLDERSKYELNTSRKA